MSLVANLCNDSVCAKMQHAVIGGSKNMDFWESPAAVCTLYNKGINLLGTCIGIVLDVL